MKGLHLLQGKHCIAMGTHKKAKLHLKKGRGMNSIGAFIPREEGEGIKKHNRLKPLKFKI